MGRTKPPRPKIYANETERRILAARSRFKHQPDGFMRIWAAEFISLQASDGFDTFLRNHHARKLVIPYAHDN